AVAFGVGVRAVRVSGRLAVDRDPEADFAPLHRGTEHEMQIARVEAVDDAAVRLIELRTLAADRPFPGQRPFVQLRLSRRVTMALILHHAAWRHESVAAVKADIRFR